MQNKTQSIVGSFGRFTRDENGLIYFFKADDIAIDKSTAEKFLEIVAALDGSGTAQIIVIQGHRVEYSFDAQRLLLTSDLLANIAYVTQTTTQHLTAELLQDLAKTLRSHVEIQIFNHVEEAETWLLGS